MFDRALNTYPHCLLTFSKGNVAVGKLFVENTCEAIVFSAEN